MTVHRRQDTAPGAAQDQRGIGVTGLVAALCVAFILFSVQMALFLCLRRRKHLSYMYNPKQIVDAAQSPPNSQTEKEATDSKTGNRTSWLQRWYRRLHHPSIQDCGGSDAYYFLRYLRMLLHIFVPILFVVAPILVPLNFVGGRGQDLDPSSEESSARGTWQVIGLDTLAFGNVRGANTGRYATHLACAAVVTLWFCFVACTELRKYVECAPVPSPALQNQLKLIDCFELSENIKNEGGKTLVDLGKTLNHLLEQREEALAKFESSATTLVKDDYLDLRRAMTDRHDELLALEEKTADAISNIKKLGGLRNHKTECLRGRACPCEKVGGHVGTLGSHACHCEEIGDHIVDSAWHDIVWSNVGLAWWKRCLRATIAAIVLALMIGFWAVPVSLTSAFSQLDYLVRNEAVRSYFADHIWLKRLMVSLAAVLPGAALAVLHLLLSRVLLALSWMSGAKVQCHKSEFVQRFYFVFLFVQIVLVVSISSFFTASVDQYWHSLRSLQSSQKILNLLSQNLPSAANYFFSYMILQAFSASSNILMQRVPTVWSLADCTPRQKWQRGGRMDIVDWGRIYPLYTTLACISVIYSVIAPVISVFAVISFALLSAAQSYSVVYVSKACSDHGGVLYPRAINQTFTGLYVMQLCMVGLFLGVEDDEGRQTCFPHGITMMGVIVLTAIFQLVLNSSYLPQKRRKCLRPRPTVAQQDDELLEYLGHVTKRRVPWVPDPQFASKFGVTETTNEYPPSGCQWRATIDKSRRVRLLSS